MLLASLQSLLGEKNAPCERGRPQPACGRGFRRQKAEFLWSFMAEFSCEKRGCLMKRQLVFQLLENEALQLKVLMRTSGTDLISALSLHVSQSEEQNESPR